MKIRISNMDKIDAGVWYDGIVEGSPELKFQLRPSSWLCHSESISDKILNSLMYSCTGWNLKDEDGNDVPCSDGNKKYIFENYVAIASPVYVKIEAITVKFRLGQVQEEKEIKN